MQSQRHEEDWTNQIEKNPLLIQPSYPIPGFDGLHEGGTIGHLRDGIGHSYPIQYNGNTIAHSTFNGPVLVGSTNASNNAIGNFSSSEPIANSIISETSGFRSISGPANGANFIGDYHSINSDHGHTVHQQNQSVVTSSVPALNNGDWQSGKDFIATSMPTLQDVKFQYGGDNGMTQGPQYTANDGLYGPPFPDEAAEAGMGNMTMNALYLPNVDAVRGNFDWPGMEDLDNMMISTALDGNVFQQALPSNPPAPQAPPVLATPAIQFACNHCQKTFKRDADRVRHENSVHFNVPGALRCSVAGCPKSQGAGYRRQDKLTEHMWKKHAALGYAKRV